MHTIA